MPYGTIKVDTITFTDAGVDKSVAISGLVQNPTFTGNVTATGTISGLIVQAPTVTGTTANFASGVYTTQISGAIVKVPAGGAGAPSIQVGVGASVAPGLYGAGTDLLGISTGGAGRIFIDSTGRLGVGTSNPTELLEISATTDPKIHFIDVGNTTAKIGIVGSTALGFEVAGTERLRIDSAGRVGIGTSSPSTKLSVVGIVGGLAEAIRVNSTAGTQSGNSGLWLAGNQSTSHYNWLIASQYNVNAALEITPSTATDGSTFSTPTAVFTQTGRVGIGTSNPQATLDVGAKFRVDTTSAFGALSFARPDGTHAPFIRGADSAGTGGALRLGDIGGSQAAMDISGTGNIIFYTNTATTERLRINSSGNVGIGTSSQYSRLYVAGTQETDPLLSGAVGPVVSINETNNADTTALRTVLSLVRAGKAGVSYGNQVNFNIGRYSQVGFAAQTQLTLRLAQGNQNDPDVDVLTLLSSGNVGIGSAGIGANHALEVSGNQKYLAVIANAGGGGTANPSSSSGLFLGWNRTNGEGESNIIYGTGSGTVPSLWFSTWDGTTFTNRMRLTNNGYLLLGGATSSGRGGLAEFTSGTPNVNADFSGTAASFVGPGLVGTSSTRATISVEDNSATALNVGGSIGFGGRYLTSDSSYAQWAAIAGKKETGTSGEYGGYLGFYTRTHAINTIDERMRITSTGRVGIGTSSPGAPLHVLCGSEGLRVETSASSEGYIRFVNTSGSMSIGMGGAIGNNLLIYDRTNNQSVYTYAGGASGYHGWSINNAERLRIDSSGRVLVGTSTGRNSFFNSVNTYGGLLQVEGTGAFGGTRGAAVITNNSSAAGEFPYLVLAKANGSTVGSTTIVASEDTVGSVSFQGSDGSEMVEAASIEALVDGTPGSNDMPGRLVFSTTADGASSPTERMRIESNGNARFSNLATIYPTTDNAVTNGGSGFRWSAIWAANGTIQTSDERAKTDVSDAELGFNFIKSLRPVSYKWVEGGKVDTGERDDDGNYIYQSIPGERTHWGFIAQEVKEAVDDAGVDFGGWILTDKDDPNSQQALRYDQFIAPLTKALQEAIAKIETLEAKVAALEGN